MAGLTTAASSRYSSVLTSRAPEPPTAEGRVKGTLLLARVRFLLARGTVDAERVLWRVSVADQEKLRGRILPSVWYPAGLLKRFENGIAEVLADGDRHALFLELGRFSARTNLGPEGVQRPWVREGDPQFLLANLPRLYASQHGSGHRVYEKTGPRAAVVRHFDTGAADPFDCLTAIGWLEEAVAVCGGRAPSVEETLCRAHGSAYCELAVRWS